MSYVIGGLSGEASAFDKIMANSAIETLVESNGFINDVARAQLPYGQTFKQPKLAPISWGNFDDTANPSGMTMAVQNPTIGALEVTALPMLAQTAFSEFYGWITSFPLADDLGKELGGKYVEKIDQMITGAFKTFKATPANANYPVGTTVGSVTVDYGDGFDRISQLGALELVPTGTTLTGHEATTANTINGLIDLVIFNWRQAGNPGAPLVVLSHAEEQRLLSELTSTAYVANGGIAQLSPAGQELQATGMIRNFKGVQLKFTRFLAGATRSVMGATAGAVKVGGAFSQKAITAVMVREIQMEIAKAPSRVHYVVTGTAMAGAGATALDRGLAINVSYA